ncbi:ABC transporter permease [Methylicorpusculum oleiharenae]|jgi:ABC-2 type transport system permease protein|uniref:ABC transporter permease n=1 Tax=Methylicorpusculum oleiharenae TaxID=1338687 RepID=UPI0013582BC7|nr:ABC transporter permease [Methylicorpusculum oleiharenae]MCD2453389.1 ABC transporter permease [Methylicorpusculum oleiharenae]
MYTLLNIFHLGIKELRSLGRDTLMMVMIGFAFSGQIYVVATGLPQSLNKAPIAIIDEDRSPLSARIANAFYPPYFLAPVIIDQYAADFGMDAGLYTFILDIPPDFQRDLLAGRQPAIQLNVDATRISQAFIGNNYVQTIVNGEVSTFVQGHRALATLPIELETRALFNPNLNSTWFGSVMELVNSITALSIVLTGAALIREREHGTIEHLLVMPLTPFEIMMAKVWAMGLIVVVVATASLVFVVQGLLEVPIHGSIPLFVVGMTLYLFTTTSLGIFLATMARSMPQFGLLLLVILLPLQMLSGGMTPRESMPELVQNIMLAAPTTHFVSLTQAILYRGAGISLVWPQFLALITIGSVFFVLALTRFRKTISSMA